MSTTQVTGTRYVFFHYPKTAGQFIRKYFANHLDLWVGSELIINQKNDFTNHHGYNQCKDYIRESDITFSIVRNPFKLLEDRYFFSKQEHVWVKFPMFQWLRDINTFEEYIMGMHFKPRNLPHWGIGYWNVGTQSEFNKGCNTILRLESLQGDIEKFIPMSVSWGIPYDYKVNATVWDEPEWTSDMSDVVHEYFHDDFEAWY